MAGKKNDKPEELHPIGAKLLWIEKPQNITRMIIGLGIFCALLFLADFTGMRYGHFSAEGIPGFYGVMGFLAFSFIIISTKYLRMIIGRREDYYGKSVVDPEDYPDAGLEKREHGDV